MAFRISESKCVRNDNMVGRASLQWSWAQYYVYNTQCHGISIYRLRTFRNGLILREVMFERIVWLGGGLYNMGVWCVPDSGLCVDSYTYSFHRKLFVTICRSPYKQETKPYCFWITSKTVRLSFRTYSDNVPTQFSKTPSHNMDSLSPYVTELIQSGCPCERANIMATRPP